jgi:hypothetical protein
MSDEFALKCFWDLTPSSIIQYILYFILERSENQQETARTEKERCRQYGTSKIATASYITTLVTLSFFKFTVTNLPISYERIYKTSSRRGILT